jgi:dihydropteroate synthase
MSDRGMTLFVTGRLAEPSLRAMLAELASRSSLVYEVAVLPISVAALMTPRWVARHLEIPPGTSRVVLPGHCRGDLTPIREKAAPGVPIELGPEDLRTLPRWLGLGEGDPRRDGYGSHNLEILAEINHAPRMKIGEILEVARRYRDDGADVIDLGCDPGGPWPGVADAVKALRDAGHRVSIDSFDPAEVEAATRAGAELVLSVNASNRDHAIDWHGAEVVALPDVPGTLDGLGATIEHLAARGVRCRIDPILEPIGFGFARSLGRALEARSRWPDSPMMLGVGNLTELTDVDSAGLNVALAGFCAEAVITSVLTTQVINWARSSVKELDLARRLVHHAVARRTPPKRLEPGLVLLRDVEVPRFGREALEAMQARVKDPNWRLFAEDGTLYALNSDTFAADPDPFALFAMMGVTDASHAFYLGYEMAKARIALTLSKAYRQDRALDWGFLTEPEEPGHRKRMRGSDPGE